MHSAPRPARPPLPRHPGASPPTAVRAYRWALAEGVGRTVRRFRGVWAELPDAAWRRWLWTVILGLVACSLTMFVVTTLGERLERAGALAWDERWLRWILAHSPLSVATAIWAETPGNGVFMIPVVLASALLAVWLARPLYALSILASYFLLDVVVGVGWFTWNRARPDLVLGGVLSPGLHAFPSGHVAQVVSAYGFLMFLWIRSSRSAAERTLAVLLLVAVAAVVGLARLVLGAHWPSDMVAGAAAGAAWLAVVVTALRRAEAVLPERG